MSSILLVGVAFCHFSSHKNPKAYGIKVFSREIEEIKSNRATGNDVNTGRIME